MKIKQNPWVEYLQETFKYLNTLRLKANTAILISGSLNL